MTSGRNRAWGLVISSGRRAASRFCAGRSRFGHGRLHPFSVCGPGCPRHAREAQQAWAGRQASAVGGLFGKGLVPDQLPAADLKVGTAADGRPLHEHLLATRGTVALVGPWFTRRTSRSRRASPMTGGRRTTARATWVSPSRRGVLTFPAVRPPLPNDTSADPPPGGRARSWPGHLAAPAQATGVRARHPCREPTSQRRRCTIGSTLIQCPRCTMRRVERNDNQYGKSWRPDRRPG